MKARVKLTGPIVDVVVKEIPQYRFLGESTGPIEYSITRFYDGEHYYRYDELDFDVESFDYWTKLEHQYAGMAMQGMLSNAELISLSQKAETYSTANVTTVAMIFAHALVEKYKKEEK